MIMSKFWLKITVAGILALAITLVALIAYWPTETLDERHEGELAVQPKVDDEIADAREQPSREPGVERAKVTRQETMLQQEKPDPNAEKLYRIAGLSIESGDPPETRYETVLDCCYLILNEYPNSPEAEKATQLLQEVPEEYREQYYKEKGFLYSRKPTVIKSRPLRRRP